MLSILLQETAAESYKKFHEAARRQTWGAELCANDFDHNLWPTLFKRINFECRNSGERKLKRPALNLGIQYEYLTEIKNVNKVVTKADIEVVYPDIIFNGDGLEKLNAIHIFVQDIFIDLPGVAKNCFEDQGIKQFRKMMTPPYTNGDPDIRKKQIISVTFSLALHYYRFIVDQCGGCPALIVGSYETSTAKTMTTKLVLKTVSDSSHFLAQSSSEQSLNSLKAKTSMPFAIDDIESKAIEHRIILSSFNGATKTTIGRGREKPLGGLIMSKNFKENEIIEEKDDEGRTFVQIYDKRINDDIEEAYEAEADHADVMEDNILCRDFLARMTPMFLKNKGQRSGFQEKHQAACGILTDKKPGWGNRKIKSYALPLTTFLMIEEVVEDSEDREIEKMFVEVYKDRATFIDNLVDCYNKTDELLDKHIKRRDFHPKADNFEITPSTHDTEVVIGKILDLYEGKSIVETTNVIKGFTKKNGIQIVAVAHTKLKGVSPELAKAVKEIKEADKDKPAPAVSSGINTFTKAKAERHIGAGNTESKTSIEFPFKLLSDQLIERLRNLFEMPSTNDDPQTEQDDDSDMDIAQSQDYPGMYQSMGRDTMKFCTLCDYTTRCANDMSRHVDGHPECILCKKRLVTAEELVKHMEGHATFGCTTCGKDVLEVDKEKHENMHKNHKKQLKALDKGKVTKSKTKSKPSGYNVFVKQKFAEISEEFTHLTNAEVMKVVGSRWKALSKDDQKHFCDLAEGKSNTAENEGAQAVSSKIDCMFCEKSFANKELAKKHVKEHMSGGSGNQLNRIIPDDNQDQIKKCNVCGLMVNQNTLEEHLKSHGPEVTLEELANVPEVTLEEQVDDGSNPVMVEETEPRVVMVKMRTKYWPAQVISSTPGSYEVMLFKRGDKLKVKKTDCKEFTSNPDACKGQSRDWKECFKAAVDFIQTDAIV